MKDFKKNIAFAWKYAKNEKKSLIILIITNIISIILNIIIPVLSAQVIISLTTNEYKRIIYISGIILLVRIITSLFNYVSRNCYTKIYRNTVSLLEVDLSKNILMLENNCLDKNGSGVFIQRLTNDTSKMADVFNSIIGMLSELLEYIGILIAVFIVSKIIFVYILITLIILYMVERIRTNKRNEDDKVYRKSKEKVSGFIGELVRGARDIKMLNCEKDFIKELSYEIDDSNYKRMKMQKTSWKFKLVMWQLDNFFRFILIILFVVMMMHNVIIASLALVLYDYSSRLSYSVYLIGDLLEYFKDFNLSTRRIWEIINGNEYKKEIFGKKHLNKVKGDFEFKNVTFAYKDKNVLENLSFKINANETVAFVGKSGAGKSTIFNLLCKMYDVSSGEITIDNININELDKNSIRGNITIISQNPYIFNLSIKDNLRLVKSNVTNKEIEEACKVACLDEFIKELPLGYDTVVGEGGINLSGGQKQRLAIARALVQKN